MNNHDQDPDLEIIHGDGWVAGGHGDDPERHGQSPDELPRPRHRVRRTIVTILVILLVAVLVYAGIIINNVVKISTQPLNLSGLSKDGDGRVNVLVLGKGDPGHAGEGLTDTIMVLSLNTKTNQVAQISVPRDLRVTIPGYGTGKINAANARGGVELAEQTVSNTLGIPIHYYIVTDFSGLAGLVDAVGGLDVDVKTALIDNEYPCDDNQYKVCGLSIPAGQQHMDGATVLKYTRCRKGTCGNDFGRAARQQEVLGLLRDKATSWQTIVDPRRLTPLTAALRSTLTTNMSAFQMALFARDWQTASKNNPIHLVLSTSNGGYLVSSGGSSDLLPADGSFRAIQDRVQNIFTEPAAAGDVPAN